MLALMLSVASAVTIRDMRANYSSIFKTGNRNAASHLWASWILDKAADLQPSKIESLFGGFCPISGSPVVPSESNRWEYSLPTLSGDRVTGVTYHCCSPCVCDTQDFLKVDTKTISTAAGERRFNFLVYGDPCLNATKLREPYRSPFGEGTETLTGGDRPSAPELTCSAGKLTGAHRSDHDGIIVGMLAARKKEESAQSSTEAEEFCRQRAAQGFNSGMGVIFRKVALIHPLLPVAPTRAALPPPCTAEKALVDPSRIAEMEEAIRTQPVTLLGMPHMRCTDAAVARLEGAHACFHTISWTDPADPLWTYLQCLHPHETVGTMQMHSYVYIGGQFVGNGFKLQPGAMSESELTTRLADAKAGRTCEKDCTGIDGLTDADLENLRKMKSEPLALLGWMRCPCTGIARRRFEGAGACFVETVWPEDNAPLYKYLQCVHGSQHHSFVFFGGKFVGDGFALSEDRMTDFDSRLDDVHAVRMCQREGDKSLVGGPLQSCTQSSDGTTTGWTRSGSCVWDPMDSGYHQVCVTMSDTFLASSAQNDGNDLSSVVSSGGHWCICAWAWASAVQRDKENFQGISLECDRTNARLRKVYQMHIEQGHDLTSPSGASYKAQAALDALNKVCPEHPPALPAAAFKAGARAAMADVAARPKAAADPSPLLVSFGCAAIILGAVAFVRASRQHPCSDDEKALLPDKAGAASSDDEGRLGVARTPRTAPQM